MLRFIFSILLLGSLVSCSFVDVRDRTTYEHDNKRVPEEVIAQIKAGKTSKKWVMEYVGKPDQITRHKNGSEIFTYRFSENRNKRFRVLFLFKYEDTGFREKHVYIHFVDDVVFRLWRDYTLPTIPEDMYEYQMIDSVTEEDKKIMTVPSRSKNKKKTAVRVGEFKVEDQSDSGEQGTDKAE